MDDRCQWPSADHLRPSSSQYQSNAVHCRPIEVIHSSATLPWRCSSLRCIRLDSIAWLDSHSAAALPRRFVAFLSGAMSFKMAVMQSRRWFAHVFVVVSGWYRYQMPAHTLSLYNSDCSHAAWLITLHIYIRDARWVRLRAGLGAGFR